MKPALYSPLYGQFSMLMDFVEKLTHIEASYKRYNVEHLFLGLLALSKKSKEELLSELSSEEQTDVISELQALKELVKKHRIHVKEVSESLRYLLKTTPYTAELSVEDLIMQAKKICRQRGTTKDAASLMLELILNSPTTLIQKALKTSVRINGCYVSGNIEWAAFKYFFHSIAIPSGLLGLAEVQFHLISDPPIKGFLAGLPYIIACFSIFMCLYGIVSLIRKRYEAFAEFLRLTVNLTLCACWMMIHLRIQQKEALGTVEYICFWIVVFFMYSTSSEEMKKIERKLRRHYYTIKTMLMRFDGTPALIFFSFLIRSTGIALFICSIITLFNLSDNEIWKAIFSIFGFLWAYTIIRMLFRCNLLRFKENELPHKALNFGYSLSVFSFPPALGLFLMWYFDWFPMQTWVIWAYSIYGLFLLLVIVSFLLPQKK